MAGDGREGGYKQESKAMKRKGIGKKKRFEIFKRDGFKCSYCGRSPPEVMLEVDHILAVANGGDNDEKNLITSCRDCNAGKSATPLNAVAPALSAQLEEQRERADQIAAYNELLMDLRARNDAVLVQLGKAWFNAISRPEDRDRWSFGATRAASIRSLLKHLAPAEILEAMDITAAASDRIYALRASCGDAGCNDNRRFKYFCGVCWRMIDQKARAG
jgi:hypothetical protein